MIKNFLAKNKAIQRTKELKDLVLEKLDLIKLTVDQLAEEGQKNKPSTNILLETQRNTDVLLENSAFLLQYSVEMARAAQNMINLARDNANANHKQETLYEDLKNQVEYLKFQTDDLKLQGELAVKSLTKIHEDVNRKNSILITDPKYFQDIDIELVTYLYSYLPNNFAIDIGANKGDVSSRLLQAGYHVYAFEPFLPVFEKLNVRLSDNSNFHAFALALGSANETRDLHIATDRTESKMYQDSTCYSSLMQHSLSEGLEFTGIVPVEVRTLESLHNSLELPKEIGLVKIDTEGFDLEVIRGMGSYNYPVVVAKFWDANFPFGRSGALNHLQDLVAEMRIRNYQWHIVIYRVWGIHDISYYCNSSYSIDNSSGNVFFFQDYQVFSQALKWCSSVMPSTYFTT
jgi:FkbM family methyltransferase